MNGRRSRGGVGRYGRISEIGIHDVTSIRSQGALHDPGEPVPKGLSTRGNAHVNVAVRHTLNLSASSSRPSEPLGLETLRSEGDPYAPDEPLPRIGLRPHVGFMIRGRVAQGEAFRLRRPFA